LFPAEVGVSAFAGGSGNRREIGLSLFRRQLFSSHLAALLTATTSAVQTVVSGRIGLRRHAGRRDCP